MTWTPKSFTHAARTGGDRRLRRRRLRRRRRRACACALVRLLRDICKSIVEFIDPLNAKRRVVFDFVAVRALRIAAFPCRELVTVMLHALRARGRSRTQTRTHTQARASIMCAVVVQSSFCQSRVCKCAWSMKVYAIRCVYL